MQLDHIRPFSQGGLSVAENLRTLCADCNVSCGPHA
ncbi:MAG: HNH endonuclease [Rhodospirillales bacterium]|nr:HNH endonuclease [Rhodospirillales bacterium]